ncbi:2-hydroxychromene-2-carboxylate isomerase [Burkholderia sp. AD24]|nr:2-hydroxychromene-2-carboxylate isomerase [Burkholderia sp. AD24]
MTNPDLTTRPSLQFWFDFGSTYSYLSMMRIEALAQQRGVAIEWRPFLLGAIFKSFGWDNSPFVLQKEKGAYMWRDMARQCEKCGLPWTQPSEFPRRALLPLRVALVGAQQHWIGAFCKRMMQINFVDDRNIDEPDLVARALSELDLPAEEIIAAALSEQNKRAMRAQTDEAVRRGIFGAPTFFVGEEMFWGNDRLEDALLLVAR